MKHAEVEFPTMLPGDSLVPLESILSTEELNGRQEDMRVVAKATDGREAVDLWKTHRPDAALVDLRMAKLNGVAGTSMLEPVAK